MARFLRGHGAKARVGGGLGAGGVRHWVRVAGLVRFEGITCQTRGLGWRLERGVVAAVVIVDGVVV